MRVLIELSNIEAMERHINGSNVWNYQLVCSFSYKRIILFWKMGYPCFILGVFFLAGIMGKVTDYQSDPIQLLEFGQQEAKFDKSDKSLDGTICFGLTLICRIPTFVL